VVSHDLAHPVRIIVAILAQAATISEKSAAKGVSQMDMSKYTGTAFIKVATLTKGTKCKKIESIAVGQYDRPVITFSDGQKLSLNVTNVNTMVELFGQDSDDWIGKLIELYVGPLRSQDGGEIDGVKVRSLSPPARSQSAGADIDDKIPF